MNDTFWFCLEHVLKSEGGYTNHVLDRGGPTNFGITMKTLNEFRTLYMKQFPTNDTSVIEKLTKAEAAEIYFHLYWEKMNLTLVRSKIIALILFDQGVNRGCITAIQTLQKVLALHFKQSSIGIDGILGIRTSTAISVQPEGILARKLLEAAQSSYVQICVNDPKQLVFLQGWMNRTFKLSDAIA